VEFSIFTIINTDQLESICAKQPGVEFAPTTFDKTRWYIKRRCIYHFVNPGKLNWQNPVTTNTRLGTGCSLFATIRRRSSWSLPIPIYFAFDSYCHSPTPFGKSVSIPVVILLLLSLSSPKNWRPSTLRTPQNPMISLRQRLSRYSSHGSIEELTVNGC